MNTSTPPEPLVSIVIPCYNYARYLGDCLTSIFTQEGDHDIEVIAIDDASVDNTQEVLRAFARPNLRVITHPENKGHIFTITEGLRQARGKYVARIDCDDRYRPYYLNEVLSIFERFPEVGVVYGNVALINASGVVTVPRADRVHNGHDFRGNEFIKLLQENFICAPTLLAKRELWLAALPVPAGLAFNDWYFTLMMARRAVFYYSDKVLAEYRVHGENYHVKIVDNKSEEASIFRLLDRIFGEHEADANLEIQKRHVQRRIYGAQYLAQATKYFGREMNADSRRCYLQAIRHNPGYLMQWDVLRHLSGTIIGRDRYEALKVRTKALRRAYRLGRQH